jgi:hypothetical protein
MPSFLDTPAGKLAQYRRRKRRRLDIVVADIEPQSKKMADTEKDDFQRKVLERLKQVRRAAFRGPLALSVQLSTTKATAPQTHTIAKNLLDLLGPVRPTVRSDRRHILYKDDSQIHALSVSCEHGNRLLYRRFQRIGCDGCRLCHQSSPRRSRSARWSIVRT